jgi:hypothetical protein
LYSLPFADLKFLDVVLEIDTIDLYHKYVGTQIKEISKILSFVVVYCFKIWFSNVLHLFNGNWKDFRS